MSQLKKEERGAKRTSFSLPNSFGTFSTKSTKEIASKKYINLSHKSESLITVDTFGNILSSGDTIQLTRELAVKGTKVTLKKGTKVKNIRLTDDIEEITANTPEIKGLVLRTEFVKKVD